MIEEESKPNDATWDVTIARFNAMAEIYNFGRYICAIDENVYTVIHTKVMKK